MISFIDPTSAIDLADTTINQYKLTKEWREDEQSLNKLMSHVKRANTALRNKQEELRSLKKFAWFKPEYEKFYQDSIIKAEARYESLKGKHGHQKLELILDRILKCAEICDLIIPGINCNATIGVSIVKLIKCSFEEEESKKTKVIKDSAIALTKLAAKAGFDYLFPQASPYVPYAIINAGEKACSLLINWPPANVKIDAGNTALKIAATMAIAHFISCAASILNRSVIPGAR